MDQKILATILIVFGGLILFSEQEGSWIVSAIFVGVGSGLFFFKKAFICLKHRAMNLSLSQDVQTNILHRYEMVPGPPDRHNEVKNRFYENH